MPPKKSLNDSAHICGKNLTQQKLIYPRGWEQGVEMTQALYAHMNNTTIKKKS
jgi:hypothetical protein